MSEIKYDDKKVEKTKKKEVEEKTSPGLAPFLSTDPDAGQLGTPKIGGN